MVSYIVETTVNFLWLLFNINSISASQNRVLKCCLNELARRRYLINRELAYSSITRFIFKLSVSHDQKLLNYRTEFHSHGSKWILNLSHWSNSVHNTKSVKCGLFRVNSTTHLAARLTPSSVDRGWHKTFEQLLLLQKWIKDNMFCKWWLLDHWHSMSGFTATRHQSIMYYYNETSMGTCIKG